MGTAVAGRRADLDGRDVQEGSASVSAALGGASNAVVAGEAAAAADLVVVDVVDVDGVGVAPPPNRRRCALAAAAALATRPAAGGGAGRAVAPPPRSRAPRYSRCRRRRVARGRRRVGRRDGQVVKLRRRLAELGAGERERAACRHGSAAGAAAVVRAALDTKIDARIADAASSVGGRADAAAAIQAFVYARGGGGEARRHGQTGCSPTRIVFHCRRSTRDRAETATRTWWRAAGSASSTGASTASTSARCAVPGEMKVATHVAGGRAEREVLALNGTSASRARRRRQAGGGHIAGAHLPNGHSAAMPRSRCSSSCRRCCATCASRSTTGACRCGGGGGGGVVVRRRLPSTTCWGRWRGPCHAARRRRRHAGGGGGGARRPV